MCHSVPLALLLPEITDQIIDYLHGDISSLRACCLTTRAWVASAQTHIFHDVKLTPASSDAFAVLLEAKPHLSRHVKALHIRENLNVYEKSTFVEALIPVIAPKLTRLETLRVSNVDFFRLHPAVQSAFISSFSSIRTLSLSRVIFKNLRDFIALLLAHPHVENISIADVWWSEDSMDSPTEWEFLPQPSAAGAHLPLRSIVFQSSNTDIIDWIVSHCAVLPVNTVVHTSVSNTDVLSMSSFLHLLGPTLEHLTISIRPGVMYPMRIEDQADLISSSTGLRTLCFDGIALPRSPEWALVLLSEMASQRIEELSFVLSWESIKALEMFNLEKMESVLCRPCFEGLKRIVFRLENSNHLVEGAQEIVRRVPRLADKGLLVFHEGRDGTSLTL